LGHRQKSVRGDAGATVRLKSKRGDLAPDGQLIEISEGGLVSAGGVTSPAPEVSTTIAFSGASRRPSSRSAAQSHCR
jgi:hypothetical protein